MHSYPILFKCNTKTLIYKEKVSLVKVTMFIGCGLTAVFSFSTCIYGHCLTMYDLFSYFMSALLWLLWMCLHLSLMILVVLVLMYCLQFQSKIRKPFYNPKEPIMTETLLDCYY